MWSEDESLAILGKLNVFHGSIGYQYIAPVQVSMLELVLLGRGSCLVSKGAGEEVLGRFSFLDCFLWRRMSATMNVIQNGKILFLAKIIEFSNRGNTFNYMHVRTLIAIPRKSTLKSISSYIFWAKCLKLGSYVLGTKTKFSREQNFENCRCPFLKDIGLIAYLTNHLLE